MQHAMTFNSLRIARGQYGSDKGKLVATVDAGYGDTKLEVRLPEDISVELLKLCAPAIAAQVQDALLDVARDGEAWLMEHTAKQIEAEESN